MPGARGTAAKRRSSRARTIATIRDVATRAGVSVATVSRTLNGISPVSEDASRRVMSAVKALKYVPHAAARSLSIRRSHTLCVLLPEVHGEFFSEVISAMDLAARDRGFHLLVSSSHEDTDEMNAVLKALRGRVDGIILMSPERGARVLATDVPTILLNSGGRGRKSIEIDNFNGARRMTEHLISLGHERIAYIAGPEHNADARERLRGYRAAMESAGLAAGTREIPGSFTEESGYGAVQTLLKASPRPTAIFAANDATAIGAMFALREAGIALPAEMTLAGFDDIPIARYLTPQLTTVRVDIAELGRRAVEELLSEIENPGAGSSRKELIATTLAIRESSAAPRRTP